MDDRFFSLPEQLCRDHNTRDPFKIASDLGYDVSFINTKKQKGMCRYIMKNYFIWINQNMSEQMQRMTCAHELGHILFHKPLLASHDLLVEMEIFDIRNSTEYEANLFAANLLIDDRELMDFLRSGYDIVSAASTLNVNVNLLAIKLVEMQNNDPKIRVPFIPSPTFLGRIGDRADSM